MNLRATWCVLALFGGMFDGLAAGTAAAAPARPPGYTEAERAYHAALSVDERLVFQVLLTSAGYFNGVPNETFNVRLFKAVQRFQAEHGFAANGMPDKAQLERLLHVGAPMLGTWGFRKVRHPARPVSIWVPFGLGLTPTRTDTGLSYAEPQQRVILNFVSVPNASVHNAFAALVKASLRDGATIHYKVMRDNWFVISSSTPDGVDRYVRYHQDGAGVTGFSLFWKNANGNVGGERIAILMSASLWSHMTGAAFVDPPAGAAVEVARPLPPALPPTPSPAAKTPAPTLPKSGGASGTGFFVGRDGTLLTNAHVIDACTTILATPDGGKPLPARLIASDGANDLALLKVEHQPASVAEIRIGARLGEPVAAFGFPLSNVLASTGNFTLGNITALAGLADDSRHLQVSTPVQPGNSGGPLLDQHGNLVGVVTGKLNAIKTAAATGDIPQNINFALKSSLVASFLETNRVAFAAGARSGAAVAPADLAERARGLSVFVRCY